VGIFAQTKKKPGGKFTSKREVRRFKEFAAGSFAVLLKNLQSGSDAMQSFD
jgi:hypothetical protein